METTPAGAGSEAADVTETTPAGAAQEAAVATEATPASAAPEAAVVAEVTPTSAAPEAAVAMETTSTGDAPEVAVVTGPVAGSDKPEVAVAVVTIPADPTTSLEETAVTVGLGVVDVPAREEPSEVVVLSPTVVKPAVEIGDTAVASTSVDPAKSPATTPPATSLQGVLRVPPSASQFLDDIEKNAEEHVQNIKLLRETVEVILTPFVVQRTQQV